MRRKLSFAFTLTAALAVQASMTSAQARPNFACDMPTQAYCANASAWGFGSYYDCEIYHTTYCSAIADGGGCYYDPRVSPAQICF